MTGNRAISSRGSEPEPASAVRCEIADGVCVITLDNPPVNVIGQAVRAGLDKALDAAAKAGAERIIITGAGRAFAAGADAKEFDGPLLEPHLPDVLSKLERLPAIAAINGTALGGGLEIALACRVRIAAPEAVLGLPEVNLGVVPGAGGTQRLPRIIGLADAARLIAEGRRISANEAHELGLVDGVSEDPLAAAREYSDEAILSHKPARDRLIPAGDEEALAELRTRLAKRANGQTAPMVALELVAGAAETDIAEGLARERTAFLDLRQGEQARALRHVFFAERAAMSRAKELGADARPTGTALVIGGGTMGAGIAYALDGVGVAVTVLEASTEARARARRNVDALFDEAVRRGKSTPEAAKAGKARIATTVGYGDLPDADIAIEAVFENMDVKREVFAQLAARLPETTVLATNTSYLDVNKVFEGVSAPERCIGLHFFSPAHLMKLLEVVTSDATSEATLASAMRLAGRLGKVPVRAGVCDGFIGNRILTRYRQICDVMLIEGALPWQVDEALNGFGMAMGPYEVQDLSGLDIAHANRQRKNLRHAEGIRYVPIADRLVEDLQRLGRKSGAGWYDYGEDGRATPSNEVKVLVEAASREAGIGRRVVEADEIVARAVTAMIDEGIRIVEEGIAARPSDIDLVLVHGYGFPRWRGGPMHHGDRIGVEAIARRVASYAEEDPVSWSVPSLLARLARDNRTFADLEAEGGDV